jgi:hypothetical protein
MNKGRQSKKNLIIKMKGCYPYSLGYHICSVAWVFAMLVGEQTAGLWSE